MIKNFDQLIQKAKSLKGSRIAVAEAADADVLSAVENARKNGLADAILVGDRAAIEAACHGLGIDPANYEIIHSDDKAQSCALAAGQVTCGKAAALMKGLVDTSLILKAVLNKDAGLRTGRTLSLVSLFQVPGYDRLLLLTDPAICLAPDMQQKSEIIQNAVAAAHRLGLERPMVAPLCAVEKLNPKMPATVDADELRQMNEAGDITGCYVSGPVSLDIAVSADAAKHKGYTGPIGGKADILLVPDIEAGNMLYKSMTCFAGAKCAGVVAGAKCPVILTSRADSDETKFYSIAASLVLAERKM